MTDELLPESRLVEFDPPEEPSTPVEERHTGDDEATGESIEERVRQEEDPPAGEGGPPGEPGT
ncbi:MAG: hypothetical protein GEU89_21335 [Kiloniellaceae bacterium]|nr:hypothetical protein [Kiloniellaceae bacterium]